MAEAHADSSTVLVLYALLVASAFLHSVSYYVLLGTVGAVATGLLNALRALGVFILSHYMYCEVTAAQCLNVNKCWAALLIISGTVAYSYASKPTV
jgi:hypothetical protein